MPNRTIHLTYEEDKAREELYGGTSKFSRAVGEFLLEIARYRKDEDSLMEELVKLDEQDELIKKRRAKIAERLTELAKAREEAKEKKKVEEELAQKERTESKNREIESCKRKILESYECNEDLAYSLAKEYSEIPVVDRIGGFKVFMQNKGYVKR